MEQKETQKLKHKLLLNGVSLLAAAVAVTAAVGQQVEYLVRLIPVASIALF